MAGSLNKVMLIGNLGADPEVRSLPNGGKVCNLSVATSESWRDKDSGERKERTEWHRVVIWPEGLVKVAEQYLSKGDKVYVEGELQTRKWQDQDGKDRYSTEVVLTGFGSTLTMLTPKAAGDRDPNDNASRPGNSAPSRDERRAAPPASRPGAGRGGQAPVFERGVDDDIPF